MRSGLLWIGLLLAPYLGAQILDTSDTHVYKQLKTYRLSEKGLDVLAEDSVAIDTQLIGFTQNYPLLLRGPFLDLGYEGSPALLLNTVRTPEIGLDPGFTAFDPYRYDLEIHRYHTDRPFTRLNYSQGQNELIYIEAQHGQQFSERLTLGIDYRRIKNHNFYYSNVTNGERVKFTDLFNTKLYTGYHNVDRSYELLAAYVWNKNDQTVSGGLSDRTGFEQAGISKTFNHRVRLSNAQSQFHEHRFKLKQYLRYAAGPLDSARPADLSRFRAQWVFESQLSKTTFGMQDNAPDSSYYGDSIGSYADTLQHLQFLQEAGHQWIWNKWTLYSGLRYAFDQIRMDRSHQLYHSTYYRMFAHSSRWDLDWTYGLTGYNQGDRESKLTYHWQTAGFRQRVEVLDRATQAYYFRSRLRFGPHQWDLNAKRTTTAQLRYLANKEIAGIDLDLELAHAVYGNLVYLTDSGSQQADGSVQFSLAQLKMQGEWSYFGFQLTGSYQHSTDQRIIQRPEWFGSSRLYTQLPLFKRRLHTQWGLEAYSSSVFDSPEYRPDMIGWSNSQLSLPSYSPISVFVNAKVKNFNFGLSFYHILEGELGEQYYSSPYYPVMPRVMRFNLRWDLSN